MPNSLIAGVSVTFPYIMLGTSESSQESTGRAVRPVYDDAIISRSLRDSSERRINKFRVFRAALDLGRKSGGSIYIIDNNNDIRHGRRTVRQMYGASILAQSGLRHRSFRILELSS